jgi:plastocyanin
MISRTSGYVVALLCACLTHAFGSEISGRIVAEKAGSAKIIAPAIYDLRGIAVSGTSSAGKASSGYERIAIWLESKTPAPASPVKVVMRQRNRRIEPDTLLVPVGSTVDFPNLDPIFHNIFSLSRTQSFDLGYYAEGHSRSVTFSRPGIVQVYCHVHPNMYGVIVVTASRWFGKPAPDGAFSLPDVPPGEYRMCVWQKSVGVIHRKIAVPEAGPLRMNVAIPDKDWEN